MSRLTTTLRLDLTIQWRNRLYLIGLALALLFGLGLRLVFDPALLRTAVPVSFLLVGGAGMLYVVALLIFEQDEHTLDAQLVAPLRLDEYLAARLTSLTLLSLAEGLLLVLLAVGPLGYNLPLLVLGVALLGALLTLVGLILGVRYRSLSDALVPLAVVGIVMQLPILYFLGIGGGPLWLLIPSSAPAMLIWGAWNPLAPWELLYGLGYSALLGAGLYLWARRSFVRHAIQRIGA